MLIYHKNYVSDSYPKKIPNHISFASYNLYFICQIYGQNLTKIRVEGESISNDNILKIFIQVLISGKGTSGN